MASKRPYNPRDRKLINQTIESTQQEQPNIEEEKIEEEDSKEVEKIKAEEEMINKINEEYEKAKNLMDQNEQAVKQILETKTIDDIKNSIPERQKPVYNFSKENGQVKIDSKENKVVKEQKNKISKKQAIMAKMLITLDEEIVKTEVEIEIHNQMSKGITDLAEEHNIQRRLMSYHSNLVYLNKKKDILSKIIKKANL